MPRLLDLFCGAGGAAMGYHRAGFEVVGVDAFPQPNYPFEFHRADALVYPPEWWGNFDVIHASPPCQRYSSMNRRWQGAQERHPDLIIPVRDMLRRTGLPYVIENVEGASRILADNRVKLCGSSFGLGTHRHRLFESNMLLLAPNHCTPIPGHAGVYGQHPDGGRLWIRKDGHAPLRRVGSLTEGSERMGIDWMTWPELKESIPPAYTEHIGLQLKPTQRQ